MQKKKKFKSDLCIKYYLKCLSVSLSALSTGNCYLIEYQQFINLREDVILYKYQEETSDLQSRKIIKLCYLKYFYSQILIAFLAQ